MKVEGYVECEEKMPDHAADVKMLWYKDGDCYGEAIGFYDGGDDGVETKGFYDIGGNKNAYFDYPPTHWKAI